MNEPAAYYDFLRLSVSAGSTLHQMQGTLQHEMRFSLNLFGDWQQPHRWEHLKLRPILSSA
jgi:hypothetical protein